ncbi:MAG: EAL domain-containing protein [Actinomycetota bacterium]|nr:EAL domain-containing protein [Actinomycetota bacterium]
MVGILNEGWRDRYSCEQPLGGNISGTTSSDRRAEDIDAVVEAAVQRLASDEVPKRPVGRYIIGLAVIAIAAVVSTILTSTALTRQEQDAGLLEVVTQQILLSEGSENAGFEIEATDTPEERSKAVTRLEVALVRVRSNHNGLRFGSETLDLPTDHSQAFNARIEAEVEPHFNEMVRIAEELIDTGSSGERIRVGAASELARESEEFREGMNGIATLLKDEAQDRVNNLRITQLVLLSVMLLLILLVALFLFRPAVRHVRQEWEQRAADHESARAQDQQKLSYLARYDPLTGLINRFLFGDRLQSAIARAKRDETLVALMFLDLDDFKAVNDHYGHATGDALLKQVAKRIVASVRETDSVGRIGGDEFTVILESGTRLEDAGQVATKILDSVAEPYIVGNRELRVTASIGIAMYPLDGDSSQALLRDADIAMYSAKAAGSNNYQYFTPKLRQRASERLRVIDGLRKAVATGDGLRLVYQPWINIDTGKVAGVEALLRWEHRDLGMVPTERFVSLAEETDLIVPLGLWAMNEACRQLKTWHDSGLEQFAVSINVSPRQLHRGNLAEVVEQTLERTGLEASWLKIELTERTLVEDTETARRALDRLRALGVSIAIDDFGTGYSSLSYLKSFPIDAIKIDREFVRDSVTDADTATVSESMVVLAKQLRLEVIAEGVETREQLEMVRSHGCNLVQGFYVSRPLATDRLPRAIEKGFGFSTPAGAGSPRARSAK